jgi:glyoxylase-like metal-dependent hydrolase (beta-lactamase superfamily II)
VFLLDGDDRPWLLDAGADSGPGQAALDAKLVAAGTRRDRLAGVVLSHTHLDHSGGLLRHRPPRLVAHRRAVAEMRDPRPRSSRGPLALRRMGVPDARIPELAPSGEPVPDRPPFADLPVSDVLAGSEGSLPALPGWQWILAEGHAPGHLMLWREADALLLPGDQFLHRWKTPLRVSDPDEDSLGAWLRSLDRALELGVETLCPGHTAAVRPASDWLRDRRAGVERALERVLAAVRGGAGTAWDVTRMEGAQQRAAGLEVLRLREVLAMLRHLAATGHLERREEGGVERYVAPAGERVEPSEP